MYKKPDWVALHIFNPFISFFTGRLGLSVRGSRILAVRGRTTGALRAVPVNLLAFEGKRYLVAPRGNTQWARNLRASGEGELRLGRRRERIHTAEVPDSEKPPILCAYLSHWATETKAHFGVSGAKVPDEELQRIAPDHPVFRITPPNG